MSTPHMRVSGHWPEYAIEAALLGAFMVSACAFTILLEHPDSPIRQALPSALSRRALVGLAMGATAVVLIYSGWGRRSGAHFNPAVTLSFLRLGKIAPADAAGYVLAQCAGGIAGVALTAFVAGPWISHPAVGFAVTVPGEAGPGVAFLGEVAISFLTMSVVLLSSNGRLAPFTGLFCGALVATYITLEAPLSGMSMNPARSLASAAVANEWTGFWIYLTAPLVGMLGAAEAYARGRGLHRVFCAKLDHRGPALRCIFRCDYAALLEQAHKRVSAPRAARVALGVSVGLVLFGATPTYPAPAHRPARPAAAQQVVAIGPVGITVSDLDRAVAFYTQVLGFARVGENERTGQELVAMTGIDGAHTRSTRLRLGDEEIELTQYLAPPGRPFPAGSRANDRWFQHVAIITSDMDRAYARLQEHGVERASVAPQRLPDWNANAGGIRAFYFRDLDGHFLEILEFPPGKGLPKWHQPSDALFRGIDHTAIVVDDTDASLRLYRDMLGLRVAGTSENWGPEQEGLNAVPGARLRITTLRADEGPGIELLEYLAPGDGRRSPDDLRANDLAHWQTRLRAADADAAQVALGGLDLDFESSHVVRFPAPGPGFREALLVRDRDGHALEIVSDDSSMPPRPLSTTTHDAPHEDIRR